MQDVRNGCEDSTSRSPLLSVPSSYIIPNTRINMESPTLKGRSTSTVETYLYLLAYWFRHLFSFPLTLEPFVTLVEKGRSPQAMRRDYGLTITHR